VDFEAETNTRRMLSAEVGTADPIIVNEVSSSGGDVKGEGHSKKRICYATTNKKFILS